jgi:hypothetical protein
MHGADESQAFLNLTLAHNSFQLRSNVHILMLMASVEGEVFGMGFHAQQCKPLSAIELLTRAPGVFFRFEGSRI